MKKKSNSIVDFVIICLLTAFACSFLTGCSWFNKSTTINTNQFYQTDYNYFCFEGDKTWSQIVVCLDAQSKAERTQNKITNDMLDGLK